MAEQLNGVVVFIEHRYYGKSMPFGDSSFKDAEHWSYLSSEQALADFAQLVTDTKVSLEDELNGILGHSRQGTG